MLRHCSWSVAIAQLVMGTCMSHALIKGTASLHACQVHAKPAQVGNLGCQLCQLGRGPLAEQCLAGAPGRDRQPLGLEGNHHLLAQQLHNRFQVGGRAHKAGGHRLQAITAQQGMTIRKFSWTSTTTTPLQRTLLTALLSKMLTSGAQHCSV
jgi:hypothetical protein